MPFCSSLPPFSLQGSKFRSETAITSSNNKPLFGGPNKERKKSLRKKKSSADQSDMIDGIGDYGPNGKVRRRMTLGDQGGAGGHGAPIRRMGVRAEITWVQNQLEAKETAIAHALEELRGIRAIEAARKDPTFDADKLMEDIYRHTMACPEPLLLGRTAANDTPTMENPWHTSSSAACAIM